MPQIHINYIAVIVAAVIAFAIGGLWYSPLLFANLWVKAHGYSEERLKEMQTKRSSQIFSQDLPKTAIPFLNEKANYSNQQITPLHGFILSRINGQWSVSEILSVVPVPEAEALTSLKQLLDKGFITVRKQS